jgi:hypothetical protein
LKVDENYKEKKIMLNQNFDEAVKKYDLAMNDFFKGNPEPINNIYSDSDEISLAQLSGSFILGRKNVTEIVNQNSTKYRMGNTTFETLTKYVTPDFAYLVQVERTNAKIGGADEFSSLALRVTSIFRLENSTWKLLHRHVDSYSIP